METNAALERHHARLRRVLAYIDHHLDENIRLETLSGVAAFSPHHFHRQFTAAVGLPVHRYVRLLRMKRAAWRLAFRQAESVTAIALDAGYPFPEAFTRAFRERLGQAPTAFRRAPGWEPWLEACRPVTDARRMLMREAYSADQVRIVEVPATAVALMEHRGHPAGIGDAIRRFIAWRRAAGLSPPASATFNVFHTDPESTWPEDQHIDLCAATAGIVPDLAQGMKLGAIPAGRCAVLRVVGSSDDLAAPAAVLYRDWLPASGEETRDFPLYCQRVSFFPDVPEHEAVTDLFLPLS